MPLRRARLDAAGGGDHTAILLPVPGAGARPAVARAGSELSP